MSFKLFSIIFFCLLQGNVYSQPYSTALPVTMNGYIVNIGGQVLFQPCSDNNKSIWESLGNNSFALWYFKEDLYLEAISNIGDSVLVNGRFMGDKEKYEIWLSYFYCTITLDMMFLDTTRFKVYAEPKYEITFKNKTYHAYGFYVDNRIKQIIPKENKKLLLVYKYYKERKYSVPMWLEKLVSSKK